MNLRNTLYLSGLLSITTCLTINLVCGQPNTNNQQPILIVQNTPQNVPLDPQYEPANTLDTVIAHLAARDLVIHPIPVCKNAPYGKDIIFVTVDKQGNVKEAKGGHTGSTISDAATIACDEATAKKSRFDQSSWGPDEQYGTIVYFHKKPVAATKSKKTSAPKK